MLKTRIVAAVVCKGGIVVQSFNFMSYLPVGRPEIAVDFLNQWGADEIMLLDIDATPQGRRPDFGRVSHVAKYCQVPLSVGGGIRTVKDIEQAVHSGADKVCINTGAVEDIRLISDGARFFGSQCIVFCMDVRALGNGGYGMFTHSGRIRSEQDPVGFARKCEGMGAGEIVVHSIDRDGSRRGYDLELLRKIKRSVGIPVVALGGVGHPKHILEGAMLNLSGVAAANFFHYTEHSVMVAKSCLRSGGIPLRADTYASYEGLEFGPDGRVTKISDSALEELRFHYIPEEKI